MKINTGHKLNAFLAITLGLGLIIGETIRRFGEWGYMPSWIDDYILGVFLIIPSILILKDQVRGIKLLIARWAITVGMTYGSFFSKLSPTASDYQSNISPDFLIVLIGMAFLCSVIGLFWLLYLELKTKT